MTRGPGAGAALAVLLLGGLAACENITTGRFGEATVVVVGEDAADAADSEFEGQVRARLRVLLVPRTGGVIDISGGAREVTVAAGSDAPTELGVASIGPGVYNGIRVVFTEVTADLSGGTGGDGHPLEGVVTIDFEGQESLTVEQTNPLIVDDDGRLVVEVNLRARRWLREATSASRAVPSAAFREAVRIRVRQEGS